MPDSAIASRALPRPQRLRVAGCAGFAAIVTLLFVQPLAQLLWLAARTELQSHVWLVPFITGYLLSLRSQPADRYRTSIAGAAVAAMGGLVALVVGTALAGSLSLNDYLASMTLAYLCVLAAGAFLFFGSAWVRAALFPIAFLMFMVPLPDAAVYWLERGLVLASADAAAFLFQITGTPLLRDGTFLGLPGIVLEVAQECSGIRSTWVLFMTSLLAANLFLTTGWRRTVLVAFVIPLAIVRNGFRILVIGLLCVRIGPHMIDSIIHRRGGPLFFVLSLAPLFLLLYGLRRQERRGGLRGRRQ